VAEDESDSALVDSNTDSFVGDFRARVTSIKTEVGSDSTIMVNQFHVGKEVKVSANAPKDETIGRVEPQKSAVDALKESDSIIVEVPRESEYINVYTLGESDDSSVVSLGKLYNATLNTDREPDSIVVELEESDNMTINALRESNNIILDAPMESDNATDHVIRDSEKAIDMLRESMDILDTTEMDRTTSEYDMMDLDILEAKSRVEIEAR
jgi:RecJ-like exonuclease